MNTKQTTDAIKILLAVAFFIVACTISDSLYVRDLEKSKASNTAPASAEKTCAQQH